jgi:hypothetical protein
MDPQYRVEYSFPNHPEIERNSASFYTEAAAQESFRSLQYLIKDGAIVSAYGFVPDDDIV